MAKSNSQNGTNLKKKSSKITSKSSQNSRFTMLTDGRLKKIVGLLFILFAIFLLVALGSYLFTWQHDQAYVFNSNNTLDFLLYEKGTVANQAGRLGAYVSHALIYNGFGLPAFLSIIFFGVWGLNLFLHKRIASTLRSFFHCILFIFLLSPVLAFFLPKESHDFPYGGALGNQVVSYLNHFAGSIGTLFLILGLALTFIIIAFNPIIKLPIWHQLFPKKIDTEDAKITPQPLTSAEPILEIDKSIQLPVKKTKVEPIIELSEEVNKIELDENVINEPAFKPSSEIESSIPFDIEQTNTSVQEKSNADLTLEVVAKEEKTTEITDDHISVASLEPYDPSLELRNYQFPTLDLLEQRGTENISINKEELEQNKNQIINTLKSFGISIAKISATVGPTVTLYEIVPSEGVRISKIRNLEDDIALSLSALGIRIIAPIPGKGTIGIEVPNLKKQFVSMRTLISSDKFKNNNFSLPIALGKKIDNENYIVDLATMPHLLMAGATGQGKSVGINTILVSLLYKKHPSQLKFVMVDPKKVELSIYKVIEKHFLAKLPNEEDAIITDTKKVINTLNALCIEMDNRYDLLKDAGVRNIKEYNEKFIKRKLLPTKGHQYLPFIVLVVDEFADLIMTAGKEVEMPIARIAQLARAVGIHLIIATQRPSVNVITGTIKANFPTRLAFRVSAKVDSRTILDSGGAEQLIGQGDMLILNGSELVRVQCAFVDTPEVERIVEFIGNQQGYPTAFDLPEYEGSEGGDLNTMSSKSLKEVDPMFGECARLVVTSGSGSTSMLQRRFNLGYNRAGRIMDQLEGAGIVGASTGGKPRELMVHTESELDEILRIIASR